MRTKAQGAVEKHICGMLLNLMLLCETVTVILFQLKKCLVQQECKTKTYNHINIIKRY